jgi:hypothetical protein
MDSTRLEMSQSTATDARAMWALVDQPIWPMRFQRPRSRHGRQMSFLTAPWPCHSHQSVCTVRIAVGKGERWRNGRMGGNNGRRRGHVKHTSGTCLCPTARHSFCKTQELACRPKQAFMRLSHFVPIKFHGSFVIRPRSLPASASRELVQTGEIRVEWVCSVSWMKFPPQSFVGEARSRYR